jgi:polyphosphate kinase
MDCLKVFQMIENFKPEKFIYNTLWVSPLGTRIGFEEKMNREIAHAKRGIPSRVIIKVNSLADEKASNLIYKAALAGVQVDLIIRGICILGITDENPGIRAVSVVDKFLEHARVYYFENAGKPEVYIGSADLMQRNIEYRVEVTTPIMDKKQIELIKSILELQLSDNTKSRVLDHKLTNTFVQHESGPMIRSQEEIYLLLRSHKLEGKVSDKSQ